MTGTLAALSCRTTADRSSLKSESIRATRARSARRSSITDGSANRGRQPGWIQHTRECQLRLGTRHIHLALSQVRSRKPGACDVQPEELAPSGSFRPVKPSDGHPRRDGHPAKGPLLAHGSAERNLSPALPASRVSPSMNGYSPQPPVFSDAQLRPDAMRPEQPLGRYCLIIASMPGNPRTQERGRRPYRLTHEACGAPADVSSLAMHNRNLPEQIPPHLTAVMLVTVEPTERQRSPANSGEPGFMAVSA